MNFILGLLTDGFRRNFQTDGFRRNFLTDGFRRNFLTDGFRRNFLTDGFRQNFPTDGFRENLPTDGSRQNFLTDGSDVFSLSMDMKIIFDKLLPPSHLPKQSVQHHLLETKEMDLIQAELLHWLPNH